jgi:hypothetical protein
MPSRLANLPNKYMNNTNTLPISIMTNLRSAALLRSTSEPRMPDEEQDTAKTQIVLQIGIRRVRMCESHNTSQNTLGTQHTPATLKKNRE